MDRSPVERETVEREKKKRIAKGFMCEKRDPPRSSISYRMSRNDTDQLLLLYQGATDIRSTIHIVESQKEKCDELRQQFSVLQVLLFNLSPSATTPLSHQ